MMKDLFRILSLAALILSATAPGGAEDWAAYQKAFISDDGRVIDHVQNAISHSEGQGYGLLLALIHDDRPGFDRILKWTRDNLQVRRDALFAWSFGRRPNGVWSIIDYNNASDGDTLIAFALLKAAERWSHPPYREAAGRIIRDMRTHLAVAPGGYHLIAPAYYGFEAGPASVFNTGYLILPAYARFADADDDAFWKRVIKDSVRLLEKASFSRFKLPADWVAVENGQVAVQAAKSPYFGYEAIRVPLYLAWGGNLSLLSPFRIFLQFVEESGFLPGRVNLLEESVSVQAAPAGFHAVWAVCAEQLGRDALARRLWQEAEARIRQEPQDYYSHTLYLLAKSRLD